MFIQIMSPVKPKRKYNSARRSEQAAGTRNLVIGAARTLFISLGWQATTIAGIAKAAKVSPETIYATFRNKEAILQAVIEKAIRGDQPDKALLEQSGPLEIVRAESQSVQIALFAQDIGRVLANVSDIMAVLRTAAATDSGLSKLYATMHESRRRNLSFVATSLIGNGPLRGDIDVSQATDHLWRLASPELFLLMTKVEGLSNDAYSDWLRDILQTQLLRQ
jgi:AcrR family transcriptional regulator